MTLSAVPKNFYNSIPGSGNSAKQTGKRPRVVTVTSGKGGVGKTLTTVHFAVAARKMGLSVLILDGDLGMANVDIVLGLQARYNIRDVLDGNVSLKEIIVDGPMGIRVIPSGSGISSLVNLSYVQKQLILSEIEKLDEQPDLLLIDTGAGISETVTHFNKAADQVIVVTTPEPHAMTDAYALTKILGEEYGVLSVGLIVNQARTADEGLKVHERLTEVAQRFLKTQISYLGHVPSDPQVQRAVMQRRAASESSTLTLAGQAWNQIARKTISNILSTTDGQDPSAVWSSLLWNENSKRALLSF